MKQGSLNQSEGVEPLSALSPLFVMATHELKSPLALMRQLSFALNDDSLSETARQDVARQILLTSERSLRLATDLTRAYRLEDSLLGELEPINPLQILEEAAREVRPLYRAKGRTMRVAGYKRPPLAIGNRELLRRIIVNFADNALHYSQTDSPVELRLQTLGAGQSIRLSVRDRGPGLTTEAWRAVRRRAGAGPAQLHNRPESSGLGIMIAQSFAKTMNADIGVIRHRDGASFYVDVRPSTQLSLL